VLFVLALAQPGASSTLPGPGGEGRPELPPLAEPATGVVRPRLPDRALNNMPPELETLDVVSVDHDQAAARFHAQATRLADLRTQQRADRAALRVRQTQEADQAVTWALAEQERADAEAVDAQAQEVLQEVAVWRYQRAAHLPSLSVGGLDHGPPGAPGVAANQTDTYRQRELRSRVVGIATDHVANSELRLSDAVDAAARAETEWQLLTDEVERLRDAVSTRAPQIERANDRLEELQLDYSATRREAWVLEDDLPLLAVAAYYRAAEGAVCAMDWRLLAGIGEIESIHGRYTTEGLDPTGQTVGIIRGPRLDGSNGFLEITDSDGGRLDGDLRFDRAVGPMQFIPTTWAIAATDGNNDGVADPHNLFDAAASAASYLCAASERNGSAEASLGAYNRSEVYADAVLASMDRYRAVETEPADATRNPVDNTPEVPPTVADLTGLAMEAEQIESVLELLGDQPNNDGEPDRAGPAADGSAPVTGQGATPANRADPVTFAEPLVSDSEGSPAPPR
jgi:hypothetical protein